MKVSVKRHSIVEWLVTPITGLFTGRPIAVVEGISLYDVSFQGKEIVGKPSAVWGALVVDDEIHGDRFTVYGLGVNRPFDVRAKLPVVLYPGQYLCGKTMKELERVEQLNIFRTKLFYR